MNSKLKQTGDYLVLECFGENAAEKALLDEFLQKEMITYKHSLQYRYENGVLRLFFVPIVNRANLNKIGYSNDWLSELVGDVFMAGKLIPIGNQINYKFLINSWTRLRIERQKSGGDFSYFKELKVRSVYDVLRIEQQAKRGDFEKS